MKPVFYRCNACGNVIVKLLDSSVPVECCGDYMEELVPRTSNEGVEKHLPVVTCIDNTTVEVTVGSVEHPMTPDHFIQFIYVETAHGGQVACLKPGDAPTALFRVTEKVVAVYEYCNVHGLWRTDVH